MHSLSFEIQKFEGFYPLDSDGIFHGLDPRGRELIAVDQHVNYPTNEEPPLAEFFLESAGVGALDGRKVNVFWLPSDYLPLGNVLNEVVSAGNDRAISFAQGVIKEIDTALKRIVSTRGVLPGEVVYEQVIVERDVPSFRFLPPVELVQANLGDVAALEAGLERSFLEKVRSSKESTIVEQMFEGIEKTGEA